MTELVINLKELKDKFSSQSYYNSCRTYVKKINTHFGWDPDVIPVKEYERNHDQILKYLQEIYTIRNTYQLGAKMSTLYYPMKLVGYDGEFLQKSEAIKHIYIEPKPLVKQIHSWDDMLKKFDEEIATSTHAAAIVICICYKHGYVLRCGEIANTALFDDPRYNYLDLKNKIWNIREELTKNRTARSFAVSDEFIDEVTPHLREKFMIAKNAGVPYKGKFTLRRIGIRSFSVNDARNAYETMNHKSDDEFEQKVIKSHVLGHTARTALAHYNPPIDLDSVVMPKAGKIKPVIKKKMSA